jgi:flagellar FliL protein
MADESTPQAQPAQKKKSKKGLILGALGALVLAGGGGAAWWFMRPAEAAAEAGAGAGTEAAAEVEEEGSGILSFEPFVVNLADGKGSRFLRVSVQLVISGEDTAAELEEEPVKKVRLRSEMLELLAEQTSDQLVTSEGKTALKAAIAERAGTVLAPHKVTDVLFSDFIVQF